MTKDKFNNQHGIFNPKDQRLKISIIGVGSSGSFIALTLAKMGFNDIEIIDFDIVELHNIPNQFYRMKDIGQYKVVALAGIIKDFTDVEVEAVSNKIENLELDLSLNRLHIICVDNVETRRYIYSQLKDSPLTIIDGGLGGEEFHTLVLNMDNPEHQKIYEDYISTEGKQAPCGMQNVIYTILNESSEICNIVKRIDKKETISEQIRRDMRSYRILSSYKYTCGTCHIEHNGEHKPEDCKIFTNYLYSI